MVDYGSLDAVKAILQPNVNADWSADDDERIGTILAVVSRQIEYKTGRVFGAIGTAETIVVDHDYSLDGDTLWLPKRIPSVTSITYEPTWNGTAWTLGTATASDDYRLDSLDRFGNALTIRTVNGSGRYVIVGLWEDTDSDATVPDDITYIANYLASQLYLKQQAGPAGFTGPDGAVIEIRDPWKDEEVKSTLWRYRVGPMMYAV